MACSHITWRITEALCASWLQLEKVTPLNLTEGISQLHQRLQALEVRFGFLRGHFQLPQLPPKFISLDLTPAAHPSSPAQVGKSPASSLLLLPPLSSTSSVLSGILPPLTQARTPRPTTAPTTTCGSIMSTAGGLDPRPIAAESRPEDLIRNLFELRDTNYRLSWYYIKNKCEIGSSGPPTTPSYRNMSLSCIQL
ncbi:hypothetical protein H4R33_004511 [Dimargaris cristalligena]|nr:hypothetical protein H4R33_004511 [Dimargaris cristalligena]